MMHVHNWMHIQTFGEGDVTIATVVVSAHAFVVVRRAGDTRAGKFDRVDILTAFVTGNDERQAVIAFVERVLDFVITYNCPVNVLGYPIVSGNFPQR